MEDVVATPVPGADFASTHEALIEAIEGEGMVVGAIIPVNAMLARTAGDLARPGSPYAAAEIVQFCSAALAWRMIEEAAEQLALCPLSVVIYASVAEPGRIVLAYRSPGDASAGRRQAEAVLRRLVRRTLDVARLRW